MSAPAPSTSRPFITRHTVIVILLAIALVLLVGGLVCAAIPRTIFGARLGRVAHLGMDRHRACPAAGVAIALIVG